MTGSRSRWTAAAHGAMKAVLVFMIAAAPASAQANPGLLVTPQELATGVRGGAVVLHVGPDSAYAIEHVAGARLVSLQDISAPRDASNEDALILELPAPTALEAKLESLGISDDSQVYVYWAEEWFSPTTRIVFTLDWAGLGDRVHVLDGGLPAWKAAGYDVTDAVPPVGHGRLTVRPRPELVVDAPWVQAHAKDRGVQVVDARSGVVYDGTREDRGLRGHIEGAGNVPFPSMFDDDGKVLGREALRDLLAKGGVQDGDTVVAYCHIGQYATAAIFAARLLGHPVKLYDGAWQDWAKRGLPAVTTATSGS